LSSEDFVELPPQVQLLVDAVSALPGVAGCFCSPKGLADVRLDDLSLPDRSAICLKRRCDEPAAAASAKFCCRSK
jgi:hypothetical protein